ncbi:MAG: hypothetical protein EXR55_00285 [Dehalococcoidia bacterium]|nr:hypothetical protein [Dehalococcoidia bacterium]
MGLLLLAGLVVLLGCGPSVTAQGGWSGVVLGEGALYVGSRGGKLLALDAQTESLPPAERLLWSFPSVAEKGLGSIYGTPAFADGRVYVGAYNGRVYSVEAERGTVEARGTWERPTGGPVVGGVVVAKGRVLVGSSDGRFYSLDQESGQPAWPPFETGDKIWSTPTVSGDIVYFGSLDHRVYALRIDDGVEVWRFQAEGGFVASPEVVEGKAYVGALDRRLYALDAATGRKVWEFTGGNWFWAKPASDGKLVYAGNVDGFVYALDARTGKEAWRFDTKGPVMAPPLLTATGLIVASDRKDGVRLWFLNPENGKEKMPYQDQEGKERFSPSFYDVGGGLRAPLSMLDGVLYVNGLDHTITALDPFRGVRQWSFSTSSK